MTALLRWTSRATSILTLNRKVASFRFRSPARLSRTDSQESEDALDGVTLPTLFGDAEGAPTEDDDGNALDPSPGQGKTGIGIAGDVSFNTVDDTVLAYIDDSGELTTDSVGLTSSNHTNLIAASGAVAYVSGGSQQLSLGIAGSFSKNVLTGDTKSYIVAQRSRRITKLSWKPTGRGTSSHSLRAAPAFLPPKELRSPVLFLSTVSRMKRKPTWTTFTQLSRQTLSCRATSRSCPRTTRT